jgi:hypothetical protein
MAEHQKLEGLVIRGAGGQLWVVRDASKQPEQVPEDCAGAIIGFINKGDFAKAREQLLNCMDWACIWRNQVVNLPGFRPRRPQ